MKKLGILLLIGLLLTVGLIMSCRLGCSGDGRCRVSYKADGVTESGRYYYDERCDNEYCEAFNPKETNNGDSFKGKGRCDC